ncbi:hypothetical protein A4X06_0g1082 [Tilletia controversa]|uniref:PEX14-like helix-turn-helix domain-containing protein n=1 Tax=Tilletia controversa TaxID=13291 RepID=A0A8X7SZX8_9BASI|nr:hypothetical protein A4X06_0g1082 [Tilletia controversa]
MRTATTHSSLLSQLQERSTLTMSLPSSSSSAEASASASAGVSSTAAYERLHSWDWSSDPEFQAGIDSITTPLRNAGRSEVQIGEVVKRAQVFYFSQQ